MPVETALFRFPEREHDCRLIFGVFPGDLPLERPERTLFILDRTVANLHGSRFPSHLPRMLLTADEKRKTLATVRRLYQAFQDHHLDRSALVIGVGGGITCDLTGFAAATFMRGIPFAFIPTTLLAQVDAALGGKNGLNLDGYKNMIGTIAQPLFVFSDPAFLNTLPQRQYRCGLAELIKAAAIADADLFHFLETNADHIAQRDPEVIGRATRAAVHIKMGIVTRDEREAGERKLLNFGHTLAHALEKISRIRHGEAVSIGMAAAAEISRRRGLIGETEQHRLITLLQSLGLPIHADWQWEPLRDALAHDKKKAGDRIDMVLLHRLGEAFIQPVDRNEMEKAYHDLHKHR